MYIKKKLSENDLTEFQGQYRINRKQWTKF